jgi:hypothetical protein
MKKLLPYICFFGKFGVNQPYFLDDYQPIRRVIESSEQY